MFILFVVHVSLRKIPKCVRGCHSLFLIANRYLPDPLTLATSVFLKFVGVFRPIILRDKDALLIALKFVARDSLFLQIINVNHKSNLRCEQCC